MPRARADKEQQLPVRGLNTEQSPLYFPEGFFVDGLNVEVDYDPLRIRVRKGLDRSTSPRLVDTRAASDHDVAIKAYLWKNVGNDPDLNWVVVQVAEFLYFLEDDGLDDPTTAMFAERYDLSAALSGTTKGTQNLLENYRVQFETIKGKLIVVGEPIDPVVIEYDSSGPSINAVILTMQKRDTVGLDSGIDVDKRPTAIGDFPAGVTASATYPDISEEHEYNLYNQGWHQLRRLVAAGGYSDPIAEFNTVNSPQYPSNADIVWVGMVESSGDLIFDAEWLKDQTFGSSPAPRGHYVVDIFNVDRNSILNNPENSGAQTGGGGAGGISDEIKGGDPDTGTTLP